MAIESTRLGARFHSDPIDQIIVALPWQSAVGIHEIIKKLKSVPVNVKICPDYVGWSLPVRGFQAIAEGAVPLLELPRTLPNGR